MCSAQQLHSAVTECIRMHSHGNTLYIYNNSCTNFLAQEFLWQQNGTKLFTLVLQALIYAIDLQPNLRVDL